ncbi:MAG: sensor histidine kinase [Cyanobacteria bacterium SBLK]|nr:sensor histidine kinase [Cyanobacteria bacterium SBLK]
MSQLNSRKLQRLLIIYSASGLFSLSAIVAAASIFPFSQQLKKNEERHLQLMLNSRTRTVDEFLLRAKDVALQITSRTRGRQLLEGYNKGEIERQETTEFTEKILTDALERTEDAIGITRLDNRENPIARVGRSIPKQFWQIPSQQSQNARVSNPIELENNPYIIIGAPIINPQSRERVGTDIVLFKVDSLQQIIQNYTRSGETGEIILGTVDRDRVEIFFPKQDATEETLLDRDRAIRKAVEGQQTGLLRGKTRQSFAFEPVRETQWGLVAKVDDRKLYAVVNRQIKTVTIAIIFVSLLGTVGTILLIRPLTGKAIVGVDKLKKQVREKTFALQKLKQTQVQLIQQEKMATLGQLVAGVAHEINNPISFIYGNIDHARNHVEDLKNLIELYQHYYPQPESTIQENLEEIELEFIVEDLSNIFNSMEMGSERIRKIVLSLRNFSRLDEANMKKVDINEGLQSTLMILKSQCKATRDRPEIEIVTQYGKLPAIDCYPSLLNQVFLNLISNAIDAIEEKYQLEKYQFQKQSPIIKIVTEERHSKWIIIQIEDNGIGIEREVREKLFEPFFTTKTLGQGTGLGLSIAYSIIVEQHGGQLSCQSQPGEGCKFIIEIPIRQVSRSECDRVEEMEAIGTIPLS